MRIGYACLTIGAADTSYRTCLQKNAGEEVLAALIAHNLQSLENAIEYNLSCGIRLFRISSDLVPFGSSPVNQLAWPDLFAPSFARIGDKIKRGGLRVSMHPGQYTVLNSPRAEIAERAAADLLYHARVLDRLGLDRSHKIILHIGGLYQAKGAAIERFMQKWRQLDDKIRQRLVIENDDKCFTIRDVWDIGCQLGIPVVFDNLHHQLNKASEDLDDYSWIDRCRPLWLSPDGPQKIHYSQQDPVKKGGSHAQTIIARDFVKFYQGLAHDDLDIMLEVKDKNLSARKCLICTAVNQSISELEGEWARYKYKILENSPADYSSIRQLLKNKTADIRIPFYDLIEHALQAAPTPGQAENAALHILGYFKNMAAEEERKAVLQALALFRSGKLSIKPVKSQLLRMAVKYQQSYLIDSYYFYL
jgi:UV DNA damage endonuclease